MAKKWYGFLGVLAILCLCSKVTSAMVDNPIHPNNGTAKQIIDINDFLSYPGNFGNFIETKKRVFEIIKREFSDYLFFVTDIGIFEGISPKKGKCVKITINPVEIENYDGTMEYYTVGIKNYSISEENVYFD